MAEQSEESPEIVEKTAGVEESVLPVEISDTEKKLRRDVARYREQARIAHSERDAAFVTAAQERDDAITAARDEARSRILQAELKTHAIRSGILDLDALKLAELDLVSFTETGELLGVEDAISLLRQRKPYLFSADGSFSTLKTTAQIQPAPQPARPVVLDARALSRDAWQAERDRLLGNRR